MDNIQFEPVCFIYICKRKIIEKVEPDFFKNKYVQKLVFITKSFHKKYKEFPFDIDSQNPSSLQIEEIARKNIKKIVTNPDLDDEENLTNFLTNVKHILNIDFEKYSEKYLKETCEAWLNWQDYQLRNQDAIEWMRSQEITPENVKGIIKKAKSIVAKSGDLIIDEDLGKDLYDPSSHIQIPQENLIKTSYPLFNRWCSEDEIGGFEPGTLTILVGESNIGKSIWAGNIATGIHLNGYNVALISVEMSVEKIHKRIGSNLFNVRMSDYKNFSNDYNELQEKIKEFKEKQFSVGIPLGTFRTKRFASASPNDIKNYVLLLEEKLGMKFHAVVIDYLTELKSDYGYSLSSAYETYQYHKQNSNDLWEMGVEHDWAMLTLHQLKISGYGQADLNLNMLGESSGIIHRTDNIFGIIQTPEMKISKKFKLKNMKGRDSSFKDHFIEYNIDYDYMRIHEVGTMISPSEMSI